MAKKPHKKLPPIDELLATFDYDPNTGGLYRKGQEHCEVNVVGTWQGKYRVVGYKRKLYLVHRIVYKMFHRVDPGARMVDHINCDPGDNRIKNLRLVKQRENARNLRKKGKFVVDDEGCSRWVSGVV